MKESTRILLAAAIAGLSMATACFDGDELVEGLRCQTDDDCGNLSCRADPAAPGLLSCQKVDDCDGGTGNCDVSDSASATVTDSASASSVTNESMSTTVGMACASLGESCDAGQACCSGQCIDPGNGVLTCEQTCYSGIECAADCCCLPTATGYNICRETTECGGDAACPTSGCAAAGSLCGGSDADCCGGRCLPNAVGSYSCFQTCTSGTECASGCCNYKSDFATSICEAC